MKAATCPTCWGDLITVICASCSRHDEQHGEVGLVTEFLRKRGWVTRPGERPSLPLQWVCPSCAPEKP